MRPVKVCSGPQIDPYDADFFKTVIDLRQDIKRRMKLAKDDEKRSLNVQQGAVKILANSTSYGIFIEFKVQSHDEPQALDCYGADSQPFATASKKTEEPGTYFNPIIAALITGAARLMLTLAECLGRHEGLDWAFCDTDSIAFVKPEEMGENEFTRRTDKVIKWFAALNPYGQPGSILKVEDANFSLRDDGTSEPLYCYAISSKRYVLFNLSENGMPIIRKASAHGLGHLRAPYNENDAPISIPAPALLLSDIGVERWQYDVWFTILKAALAGEHNEIDLFFHPTMRFPACSRYATTTPTILRWFKSYNDGRSYLGQVKPFGFILSLFPAHGATVSQGNGRHHRPKPIAPFTKEPQKAAATAFDRDTGVPLGEEHLQCYAHSTALAQYHLSPELKFANGDCFDIGRTERRRLRITQIRHIGKEADRWEDKMYLGAEDGDEIKYLAAGATAEQRLKGLCEKHGERETALQLGVARMTLRKALRHGVSAVSSRIAERLMG